MPTCSRCHKEKDALKFPPDQLRPGGKSLCRPCEAFLFDEWLDEMHRWRVAQEAARAGAPAPPPRELPKPRRRKKAPPAPATPVVPLKPAKRDVPEVEQVPAPAPRVVAEAPPPAARDLYANVGRTRGGVKAVAARDNGRRGGRPAKWSPEARALAAQVLRDFARERGATRKDEAGILVLGELLRMADVVESGGRVG